MNIRDIDYFYRTNIYIPITKMPRIPQKCCSKIVLIKFFINLSKFGR